MNFFLNEESYQQLRRVASRLRLLSALAQNIKRQQIELDVDALDDTLYCLEKDITATLDALAPSQRRLSHYQLAITLTGETGSGKTALLNAIGVFLRQNGVLVECEDDDEVIDPQDGHLTHFKSRTPVLLRTVRTE